MAKLARRGRGEGIAEWWQGVAEVLVPVLGLPEEISLNEALDVLSAAGEALCGSRLWGEADGRACYAGSNGARPRSRATAGGAAPGGLAKPKATAPW
ncbi:MAG: hypothetical protein ACK564_00195, partial [Novosphingobium sp.]